MSIDKQLVAEFFSRVLGPPVLLIFLILLFYLRTSPSQPLILALIVLFSWILPILFFAYLYKIKKISDLETFKREERVLPYVAVVIGNGLSLIIAYFFTNTQFFSLFLILFLFLLTLFFITLFYKISIHAALNTAAYLLVNLLLNWQVWWLFPLPLLAAWSRYEKKNHSLDELLAGFFVGAIITTVFVLKFYPTL